MRVAIPGTPYPDDFADNVVYTLSAMGHEVLVPPARGFRMVRFVSQYERFRAKLARSYLGRHERWLLRCVRENRVDLVLALTKSIGEEVLAETRRRGVRWSVAWWGDAPANMTGWGLLSREWDLICLKDPDGVAKFRRVGLNAMLLHEAMNPAWHRPLGARSNDKIAIAGNYYGYRQFFIRELLERGVQVALYGPPMPLWALPELKRAHTGRYIVREEKSRIFGEALACLNSTPLAEGNSLNCRAFEIAGAAGLQLIESKPIITQCFEPGAELLVFDTMDELMGHIDRARRAPGEMDRIRHAGARRALTQHTYAHRLTAILGELT
jgi:spore maturation protein CgeB